MNIPTESIFSLLHVVTIYMKVITGHVIILMPYALNIHLSPVVAINNNSSPISALSTRDWK
jgi:hypothetical protein